MDNIHSSLERKLESYHTNRNVPNILLFGPPGCGKKTLLNNFLAKVYANENSQSLCLYVNCAHCSSKGIKFIREDLKMFAKFRTNSPGNVFKSIILINGDELTIDAQSALRRCIELFSFSTRFFILAENKRKLMTPILSRFCEIYVPLPVIDGVKTNLHKYIISKKFGCADDFVSGKLDAIIARVKWNNNDDDNRHPKIVKSISNEIYENGYAASDIIQSLERNYSAFKTNELTIFLENIMKKCYDEELLIFMLLTEFIHLKFS